MGARCACTFFTSFFVMYALYAVCSRISFTNRFSCASLVECVSQREERDEIRSSLHVPFKQVEKVGLF